jgi:hypothetical protein
MDLILTGLVLPFMGYKSHCFCSMISLSTKIGGSVFEHTFEMI